MTQSTISLGAQIVGVVASAVVLLLFGLTLALPNRVRVGPGSSGHREPDDERAHEEIRPDGYIDSFAKVIEEAGGSMPPVVKLALPGVLLWWLLYLIIFWTPR